MRREQTGRGCDDEVVVVSLWGLECHLKSDKVTPVSVEWAAETPYNKVGAIACPS